MKHILILTVAACTFATVNTWAQNNSQALEPQLQQIEAHLPNELGPAQRLMERLLEQYPEDPQVNYYCGVIYGLRAGEGMLSAMRNASRSRKCTEKAVALEPTNMKYQLAALNYYLNAPSIVGGGETKARAKAADITTIDNLQGTLAQLRVVNVFDANNYTAALTQAMTKHPNEPRLKLRLGLQKQAEGDYAGAHTLFKQAAMLQADSALSEHPEIRAAQLNARYQVARNAVFSGIDVQDGIQSMEAYILAFDNDLELPELAWAHARMAQLMKLDNNEAGVETHRQLAQQLGQENDKALYELLDRL